MAVSRASPNQTTPGRSRAVLQRGQWGREERGMGGRGWDASRRGWMAVGSAGPSMAAGARDSQSGEAKFSGSVKVQVGEAHLRVKRSPWMRLSWVEGWLARGWRSARGG
jgi:hypothetical protein